MKFQTLNHLRTNHSNDWLFETIKTEYRAVIEPWFYDWFDERYLCIDSSKQNDDVWQRYFRRYVKIYCERYIQRLKTEIYDFDNTLLETFITQSKNNSTSTTNNTNTNTKTDTLKQTSENVSKNTYNSDTSGNSTDNSTNDGTTTSTRNDEQRNIHSDYPQSNVASNTVGQPTSMLWTYASDQNDMVSNGTTTDTTKTTTTSQADNTTTTEGGSNGSNNNTVESSNQSNSTNTSNGSATDNSTTETSTERHGNKSDAYSKMIDFILRCDATNWMIQNLEPLFLSTYEIDEMEMIK